MGTLCHSRLNWLDWSPGVGFITRKTMADALKNNATTPEGSHGVYTASTTTLYNTSE